MELGRVFLSSAFKGMGDFRQSAAEAARLLGLVSVSTEDLVALSDSVSRRLRIELARCDTYVALFDTWRGTVPPEGTEADRAITEEEFRIASELGLRRLAFLSSAADRDRDPLLKAFLDREVSNFTQGVWARPFDSPERLRREIAAGLSVIRPRVVLAIEERGSETVAVLDLSGVRPAWSGEPLLGPVPVHLTPGPALAGAAARLREGKSLDDALLRAAGGELASALLPGPLGAALESILDLPGCRLLELVVRSAVPEALALPWELLSFVRHPLPVQAGRLEVVRRVLAAGEGFLGEADAAPTVPADHLEILGFTAAPIEDTEQTVRLGAEGGIQADSDLFWENEQEKLLLALDRLLGERRGRLVLPETGEAEALRLELAKAAKARVVHISCHGGAVEEPAGGGGAGGAEGEARKPARRPVLLLEDETGHRRPVGARELASWSLAGAGSEPPALLVLSACSTAGAVAGDEARSGWRARSGGAGVAARAAAADAAVSASEGVGAGLGSGSPSAEKAPGRDAPGLAEALVAAGLPRVLGMQGPVSDAGATAFAAAFYRELARGVDLGLALRAGRAELAARGRAGEWALPVLLGGRGFGPLVAPEGTAPEVETPFDTALAAFDVEESTYLKSGYAGRRETERRLRNAFARGGNLIAIHGLGGIGKSTLATRFISRRSLEGARIETMFAGRTLAPEPFFEDVATRFGVKREEGLAGEEQERQLRKALRAALRVADPTVLYLDNFEDNQDPEGAVPEGLGKVLLELLALGGPGFRLLLTTRVRPRFPGVAITPAAIDLGELPPSACRKMRLYDPEGLGSLTEAQWKAALSHLGGHPKALELLGGYVREGRENALAILKRFEAVGEIVDAGLRAEEQAKGRALLVDDLLAQVPQERLPALNRLCLVEVPLPTGELVALLEAEGLESPEADLGWLRGRGLLAEVAGKDLVHRLLADRKRGDLTGREGAEAEKTWHLRLAEHLVQPGKPLPNFGLAAHHRDAAGDRVGAIDLFVRWAIAHFVRYAYRACVEVAKEGLARFPPGETEGERVAGVQLWIGIHDGWIHLGQREEAVRALEEAWSLASDGKDSDSCFLRGSIAMRHGQAALVAGQTTRGEAFLNEALREFSEGHHQRDCTVVLGCIADLRAKTGDPVGALRLYEEQVQNFESLGEVRERAVALACIARLQVHFGDMERALTLHEEVLRIFESLGDVRARAAALGDIAQLRAHFGDLERALTLHEEQVQIFETLGDVWARAVALGGIASLRARSGDVKGALALYEEQVRAYDGLGRVLERAVTLGAIAHLHVDLGDLELARTHLEEMLAVSRSFGYLDGISVALHDLAMLDLLNLKASEWGPASERLREAWGIVLQIGRAQGIAGIGEVWGQLLAGADRGGALAVLHRAREAYARLGLQTKVKGLDALIAQVEAMPPPEGPAQTSGEP